jgi:hypothetical protein
VQLQIADFILTLSAKDFEISSGLQFFDEPSATTNGVGLWSI